MPSALPSPPFSPGPLAPSPRVAFVTGATGAVGPSLVRALVARGVRVRALVRAGRTADLPEGVEAVVGDLDDEVALRRGVEGADWVFHLAAMLHVNDPGPELAARYHEVNVGGTRRLLDAVRVDGARSRVVFFSTIKVYGETRAGHTWVETDDLAPDTLYGETKAEAEALVRAYAHSVVLRVSAVYGPGMKGNYLSLAALLRRGIAWMVGDGQNRRTLVHVEDLARAAVLAAEHPAAEGATFNVTDGQTHTLDEIARAIQRAYGRREGVRYLPAGPVRAVLAGLRRVPVIGSRLPSPRLVDTLTEAVEVSGALLRERIGFAPRFGLDAGWRDALGAPAREAAMSSTSAPDLQ